MTPAFEQSAALSEILKDPTARELLEILQPVISRYEPEHQTAIVQHFLENREQFEKEFEAQRPKDAAGNAITNYNDLQKIRRDALSAQNAQRITDATKQAAAQAGVSVAEYERLISASGGIAQSNEARPPGEDPRTVTSEQAVATGAPIFQAERGTRPRLDTSRPSLNFYDYLTNEFDFRSTANQVKPQEDPQTIIRRRLPRIGN